MPWSGSARSDVYEGTTFAGEMGDGHFRAVDDAPEVGFEQLPHVRFGQLADLAPDKHSGAVDPAVEAAEPVDRLAGDRLDIASVADVGDDEGRHAAPLADHVDRQGERVAASGREHHLRAHPGRHPCRRQADSRRRAGDHDHLLRNGLELHRHSLLTRLITEPRRRRSDAAASL